MNVTPFGTTTRGQPVQRISLAQGHLAVALLTWGAVLQSVRLAGVPYDLTLGADSLAPYEDAMLHHGSLIGPVVNRLTNATAPIAGQNHRFEVNFNGAHTLHAGAAGTQRKVWDLHQATATSCTLGLTLPDGEGGFPGLRHVTARFTLSDSATLRLEVTTTTDKATLVNFANHSYWNLDGSGTLAGHKLQIAADHILPTDANFIPTGQISPVAGTEFDFRTAQPLAPGKPPLDNCYALGQERVLPRDVLWLTGASGVKLTVATSEPGVQVYDARNAARPGGPTYEGLAIEAQGWPDAPNKPGFPGIELAAGATVTQITEWRLQR